jgi:hypothetical protein
MAKRVHFAKAFPKLSATPKGGKIVQQKPGKPVWSSAPPVFDRERQMQQTCIDLPATFPKLRQHKNLPDSLAAARKESIVRMRSADERHLS